ncbi:hypothetical protein OVA13_07575 [Pseudoxanthomonas sp. SL93]|uniref:hypothetical protein n=1 Tax=Pseudoxanthomonas sp. SL93 TaxID=2995142 RepID=UPI002270CB9F|nr:hypothetical protein [Pseudoxanthomonas sp. SL93]WAC64604.1 hypothetical protein OVA13_07575 [Pseudoxanthomonas sp. SL93]
MNYDVAIGKCIAISGTSIDVHVDSSIISRFMPDRPWRRAGLSVLRIPSRVVSAKRPPAVGDEVFLDHHALAKGGNAQLDLEGDGQFAQVDLKAIVQDMDPASSAPAATKSKPWR